MLKQIEKTPYSPEPNKYGDEDDDFGHEYLKPKQRRLVEQALTSMPVPWDFLPCCAS